MSKFGSGRGSDAEGERVSQAATPDDELEAVVEPEPVVIPATGLRPGWGRPRPEKLPAPTYWPATMSLGIMLMLWGIVTTFILSGVGLVLFAVALIGWIGELRHEDEH